MNSFEQPTLAEAEADEITYERYEFAATCGCVHDVPVYIKTGDPVGDCYRCPDCDSEERPWREGDPKYNMDA
jgi:hypothetical protein